jgi:hypothetical protein
MEQVLNASEKTRHCPKCFKESPVSLGFCMYCGYKWPRQGGGGPVAWYFRPGLITFAILSFGPLALPLLWARPDTNRVFKLIISLIVILVTYWLWGPVAGSFSTIMKLYTQPDQAMQLLNGLMAQ